MTSARTANHCDWIAAVVVSVASLTTVLLASMTAIRPTPWHDPRYTVSLMHARRSKPGDARHRLRMDHFLVR